MKLLIDANLSWRLIKQLEDHFPNSLHVKNIPLLYPSSDSSIWKYAQENNFILVTNDEDFLHLLMQKGFPPKIVLLRTGNQHNKYICDLLMKRKNEIESLSLSSEYGLLEIYG